MTNKKLTAAAIAAAAIAAAPVAAPVFSTATNFVAAATTTSTFTKTGTITATTATAKYDANLNAQGYLGTSGTMDTNGSVVINGASYYQVNDDGTYYYIKTTDATVTSGYANPTTMATSATAVDTAATGTFSTGSINAVQVYDATGAKTNSFIPANTNSVYTATATLNGVAYFKIGDNMYVKQSDVTTNAVVSNASGIFTVGSSDTFVYDKTGSEIQNGVSGIKTLKAGSKWKAFSLVTIGGTSYYNVGGDQYVKASAGSFSTGSTSSSSSSTAAVTKFTAVGTVHYVPGYGIQVWTQKHGFVYNADGSKKKLCHGTSWKIFAKTKIGGETYYNLGGNQWIDSAYINIK